MSGEIQAGRPSSGSDRDAYAQWIAENEPGAEDIARQRQSRFPHAPLISIVVPVYNPTACVSTGHARFGARADLRKLGTLSRRRGESRRRGGEGPGGMLPRDARIRLALLPENRGIAGNSRGPGTGFRRLRRLFDHETRCYFCSPSRSSRALNRRSPTGFISPDKDPPHWKMDAEQNPHFKPDWSSDTLRSHNYICHLVVIRRDLLQHMGGCRRVRRFAGLRPCLRATEKASQIHRYPHGPLPLAAASRFPDQRTRKDEAAPGRQKPFASICLAGRSQGTVSRRIRYRHVQRQAVFAPQTPWCRSLFPRKTTWTCWHAASNRSRGQPTPTTRSCSSKTGAASPRTFAFYAHLAGPAQPRG